MTREQFMELFHKQKESNKWETEFVGKETYKGHYAEDYYSVRCYDNSNGYMFVDFRFDYGWLKDGLDLQYEEYDDYDRYSPRTYCYGFTYDAYIKAFVDYEEEPDEEVELTEEDVKEIIDFINDRSLFPDDYDIRKLLED